MAASSLASSLGWFTKGLVAVSAYLRYLKAVCGVALGALVGAPLIAGCQPDHQTAAPAARPVRTVTVEKREAGVPITLTGRIEAEDEVALAFRISGRLLENTGKLEIESRPARWWRAWNRRTSSTH